METQEKGFHAIHRTSLGDHAHLTIIKTTDKVEEENKKIDKRETEIVTKFDDFPSPSPMQHYPMIFFLERKTKSKAIQRGGIKTKNADNVRVFGGGGGGV